MKQIKFLAAISCVIVLCSCGNNSNSEEQITVTGANGKEYTSYREACRDGDFDAAYSFLAQKREAFEKFKEENQLVVRNEFLGSYDKSNQEKYEAMVKNYEEGMDYVFNAEMLFLTSQNTEEASNRILYLLAEYHIPGTPTAPNGEYNHEAYDGAKKYVEGISRYNNRCNSVLDMAIAQKNEKLAHSVVKIMKQNVDVEEDNGTLHLFEVSSKGVNNTDIDIAKKKLEDAIKSGAFK